MPSALSINATNVEYKMVGEGSTSAQVRMFDLVQQLVIAVDNPITGVGLMIRYKTNRSKYSLNVAQLDYDSLKKGSSNSVLFLIIAGGLPLILHIILCLDKH